MIRRAIHYGEDRLFYRSQYGHVCSLPTAWTSLSERPSHGADGQAPLFLVCDLIELVELVQRAEQTGGAAETIPGGVK